MVDKALSMHVCCQCRAFKFLDVGTIIRMDQQVMWPWAHKQCVSVSVGLWLSAFGLLFFGV